VQPVGKPAYEGVSVPFTPVMVAGLSGRVWSYEDIAGLTAI
jgi:hypothetical protein